ncbi:MAG: DegT/DnrJ/EryC1/StrS family aminotransferase [Maricaulaceae bacterium]
MAQAHAELRLAHQDEPIQFVDLAAQQARIRARIEARFSAILDHGRYINGPEVAELEAALTARVGASDVVAVGSGTQALIMPLLARGVGARDAVFIPAFTYNATANAVLLAGATPVFVDIDPNTLTLDVADLDKRIVAAKTQGLRPRAVIPVDLFGWPADYAAIHRVAQAHDLAVIADAAQSFGARLDGVWAGAIAPVTATGFFPAKALGGYGDGGAIFIRDGEALGETLRSIRWHGTDEARRDSVRVGLNGRLDSLQCAVVLEKLKIFDEELARRDAIARRYLDALESRVGLPVGPTGAASGWGYFTIQIEGGRRDAVRATLTDTGVPTAVYYAKPLHQMDAFADYAPKAGLPVTEAASAQVLSLPLHPYLSDAQAERVITALIRALNAG